MKVISFFNCRGKIGKTTMIYHLAHKFAEKGVKVLAVDLDPQAGLTEMFIPIDKSVNSSYNHFYLGSTLSANHRNNQLKYDYTYLQINSNLHILPNDLDLAWYEEILSEYWLTHKKKPSDVNEKLRIFEQIITSFSGQGELDLVLIDLGPNLSAINKSALFITDYNILPIHYDKFSLQSIRRTGNSLNSWEIDWMRSPEFMQKDNRLHYGYIVVLPDSNENIANQNALYNSTISREYWHEVLQLNLDAGNNIYDDFMSLSILKYNRSLYQMAREAGKPMFQLTPADGAIGNHLNAVRQCSLEYDILAERINETCNLGLKL